MSQTAAIQLCDAAGQAGDKLRLRSWIEVRLLGEDDSPIPDEAYEIRLPGGELVTGTLDGTGSVRLDGIPPGTCRISFPNLDKDAWTPVTTQAAGSDAGSGTGSAQGQAA
jgi:hypothetical protein